MLRLPRRVATEPGGSSCTAQQAERQQGRVPVSGSGGGGDTLGIRQLCHTVPPALPPHPPRPQWPARDRGRDAGLLFVGGSVGGRGGVYDGPGIPHSCAGHAGPQVRLTPRRPICDVVPCWLCQRLCRGWHCQLDVLVGLADTPIANRFRGCPDFVKTGPHAFHASRLYSLCKGLGELGRLFDFDRRTCTKTGVHGQPWRCHALRLFCY